MRQRDMVTRREKKKQGELEGAKLCVCEREMTEAQKKERLFWFLSLLTRLPRATEAAV